MASQAVRTSIGCVDIGRQCSLEQSKDFFKICLDNGIYDFDTAFMYSGGKSEEYMGEIESLRDPKVYIATKANPWVERGLKYESVLEQVNESLRRLKKDFVELLYLHAPDCHTPIEETLEAVNCLHKEGKIKAFGLSNYSAWQVVEIYYLCKMKNYVLPTVYQGMYNAFTRDVEKELFPCLRRFGIAFYAYNPLAGGLLTGRHRFEDREEGKVQRGRFSPEVSGSMGADQYMARYWKKPLFDSLGKIRETLDRVYGNGKVTLVDASLRWMYFHSKMDGKYGDAVIIGAASLKHLKENLKSAKHGPLHEDVVKVFDVAWDQVRVDCPVYFR